ncbi:MAG: hypothetical protein ABIE22_05295 [archaeon]
MGKIIPVKEIDDLVPIKHVFATTTDKAGLTTNQRSDGSTIPGLPENGLVGVLFGVSPNAIVISTGGTAEHIEKAGYKVIEIGDYTGWPEMETGLVKSMNPKLYVGMLAHPYTPSDAKYLTHHGIPEIDMVIVNFYPFQEAVSKNPKSADAAAIEIIRQQMDVGGPTAVHTSRKGFLTTAVATRPEDYAMFAEDLVRYNGQISIDSRLAAMKNASEDLADYFSAIRDFTRDLTPQDIRAAYPTIHNKTSEFGK